jgi:hypothetical protein
MPLEWTLVILGAAALLSAVGALARIRSRQLNGQNACRDSFFEAAEYLVADEETPERVVQWVKRMSVKLTSRTILWKALYNVFIGNVPKGDPFAKEWKSLPPHLKKYFVEVVVSSIFAVTYNNLVLGTVVRRLMLYSISSKTDGDIDVARPAAIMADELVPV